MEIFILLVIIVICYFIISNYGDKILCILSPSYKQKLEAYEYECSSLAEEAFSAKEEMDTFLRSSDSFLILEQANKILDSKRDLYYKLLQTDYKKFKKTCDYKKLIYAKDIFVNKYESFLQLVRKHNDSVLEKHLSDAEKLMGEIEGNKLDRQQMLCIMREAHSHLVIAGAGTGKTTTIIGKIKFLLKKGLCKPEEILVLSFTRASASEMKERIEKETGQPIEASTFHKLGLNIITAADGITPNIAQAKLYSFIKKQLQILMKQTDYIQQLSTYLLFNGVVAKSEFDFADEAEYEEYKKCNPPTTLKNEEMKSYGELDIANFLSQNGIAYEYEAAYCIDTRTSEYGQYHPDFYLPEYKIYIEYFGINSNGQAPPYFREGYLESMNWKRQLHKEHNTTMVECFFYEKSSGDLLKNLEVKLKKQGVIFKPKTPNEILDELMASEKSLLDGFIQLAETIINLIKSNAYTIAKVRDIVMANGISTSSNLMLLDLIEPICQAYSKELAEKNEIDFNDMINLATQYVTEQKYKHSYKFVIVDEYQDIAKSRFSLLKAMRNVNDYSLFCVGDDWQSIYRFNGSDIGFILNFAKYWGVSEISKIEKTYRFAQTLVDISGEFIMKNPNQVKKAIKCNQNDKSFPLEEINAYTEFNLADFLLERLRDLPQNSSIFFIGRYNFDLDFIKDDENFSCSYDNIEKQTRLVFQARRDLKITFLTVHGSKGLQADYVFIINNKKSRMGFPSKIQDATILELLLENSDSYSYSEERRLFYVALTRAKKKVFLLTLKGKESVFALELKSKYEKEMRNEAFTCPLCGGHLRKKTGTYGEFLGCSNWQSSGNGCKYTRDIKKKDSENFRIKL